MPINLPKAYFTNFKHLIVAITIIVYDNDDDDNNDSNNEIIVIVIIIFLTKSGRNRIQSYF